MPPFLKDKWPFFAFGGLVLLLVIAVLVSKMERPFGVAGSMLTQLTAMTTPSGDDILYVVDDPGGTPADRKITYNNLRSAFEGDISALPASTTIGSQSPCLEDGTNCPADADSQTLAQVTALGASATATLQLYGGFLASSSTVTSTFRVIGATTLATTTVEGKGICLNDGTYCPPSSGGGNANFWTYDGDADFLSPVTSTTAVSSSNFIVFQDSNNQSNLDVSGFSIRVSGQETTINDAGITTINDVTVGGTSVCLENGTNCPASGGGSDINWTWSEAGGFVRQTTTTNDLILGSTATSTGAPLYLDNSGNLTGTSTLTIGHSTNVNVVIGGTSSTQTGLNSVFVMNGNDLAVLGNIGAASSVYSNGVFRAGNTQYGNAFIDAGGSAMTISGAGGVVMTWTGGGTSLTFSGSSLTPSDSQIRLGLPTAQWSSLYLLNHGYVSTSLFLGRDIYPTSNNVSFLGTATSSFAGGYVSGTLQVKYVSSTDITVNGVSVCLSDGTNCPAGSGIPTLAQVTAMGASATATLQLYGGFLAASSTVTSTFYVVGNTTLTNATATTLFTTSLKGTSSTITTIAATDLFSTGATSTALFATSFKATSSTIATLAAGSLFFENGTSTNLYSAGTASSSLLFANMATLGGLVVSSTTVCLSSGVGCLAASASAAGIVELATIAETSAGTDATRAVTPDGLAGSVFGSKTVELYLTTSTGALLAVNSDSNTSTCFTVQPPLAGMVLTAAHVAHGVAGSGTTSTVVNIKTTSSLFLLSTPLYIDPGEYGSETAVTSSVINTSNDDVWAYERLCADVQNVENTTPGKETILSLTFSLP